MFIRKILQYKNSLEYICRCYYSKCDNNETSNVLTIYIEETLSYTRSFSFYDFEIRRLSYRAKRDYSCTKPSYIYKLFPIISSSLFQIFHKPFFASRFYNSRYFLCSQSSMGPSMGASPGTSSDLTDDVELSSSVSKLRFKVRNGSLLKVVAPRCEIPALIFRAVAFQHFILVLQSRHLLLP